MASRIVSESSDEVFFNVDCVDEDGNLNHHNLWDVNSSGSPCGSNGSYAVRPVASINWGYITNGYIRDNIETEYVL